MYVCIDYTDTPEDTLSFRDRSVHIQMRRCIRMYIDIEFYMLRHVYDQGWSYMGDVATTGEICIVYVVRGGGRKSAGLGVLYTGDPPPS